MNTRALKVISLRRHSLADPVTWLLILAFLVPLGELNRTFGVFSFSKIAMLFCFLLAIASNALKKESFKKSPLDIPLFLFVYMFYISILRSNNTNEVVGVTVSVTGYLILNIVINNFVKDISSIDKIFKVITFSVVLISVLGVAQYVTNSTFIEAVGREELYSVNPDGDIRVILGTELNPNAFGAHYAVAIPILFAYLCFIKNKISKVFTLFIVALFYFVLANTLARGAMLGCASGILVVTVCYLRHISKRSLLLCLIVLFAAGSLLTIKFLPRYSLDIANPESEKYVPDKLTSMNIRKTVMRSNWDLFIKHPIIGVGFGNSRNNKHDYGLAVAQCPHNNFLGIAAELGIAGLVPFIIILLVVTKTSLTLLKNTSDRQVYMFASALFAVFISVNVLGMTHMNYVGMMYWVPGFLIIALSKIDAAKKTPSLTLSKDVK